MAKTTVANVRIPHQEKAQWRRAARRAKLTLSEWMRLHLGIAARAT